MQAFKLAGYSDVTQMLVSPKGSRLAERGEPKGSRDNNLERHSRGRGLMTKATRTLWRLPSDITTTMPPTTLANFLGKSQKAKYASAQVSTNGDTGVYD